MRFKKEKQWIRAEETKGLWLNLDTGEFYFHGKKYQPAYWRFSDIQESDTISAELAEFLHQYIAIPFDYLPMPVCATLCSYGERYAALGKVLEIAGKTSNALIEMAKLLQEIPITMPEGCRITVESLHFYKSLCLCKKMEQIFAHKLETTPIIQRLLNIIAFAGYNDITDDTCISMTRMMIAEKLYVLPPIEISSLISQWHKCKQEAGEPFDKRPTHGILLEIVETEARYNAYRSTELEDDLRKHNDLPYLYLEDDTYICRPLITVEDFEDEAKQQANCVLRQYLNSTARGETHICSIRYKNSPDKSLITCEVDEKGNIKQYLHAYNSDDITHEEKVFGAKLVRQAIKERG